MLEVHQRRRSFTVLHKSPCHHACCFLQILDSHGTALINRLNVNKQLDYCLDKTSSSHTSSRLLISFGENSSERITLSVQKLSKRIIICTQKCYLKAGVWEPDGFKAHTTRVIAASAAYLWHIHIFVICRVATMELDKLLFKKITQHCFSWCQARSDTQFGRVALQKSLFNQVLDVLLLGRKSVPD